LNIHEYQAKEILSEYGVKIAEGGLAYSAVEAVQRAREIDGDVWVVKAQIHSGARGKAGGIKVCKTTIVKLRGPQRNCWEKIWSLIKQGLLAKICSRLYIEAGTVLPRKCICHL